MMPPHNLSSRLEGLASLDEPVRRALYLYVAGRLGDVTRDQAARATHVSRALAAFHLDKLATAGLLETTFRRLSGRTGPGAGRPSKLYRRSPQPIEVSLPPRQYEVAAHVLAQALADADGNRPEALRRSARSWGLRLARDAAPPSQAGPPLHQAFRALQACGFEPRRTAAGEIVLRNCPFDSLRSAFCELICGMNLVLIEGLLEGLGLDTVEARTAPREGMCCVALRERKPPPGAKED